MSVLTGKVCKIIPSSQQICPNIIYRLWKGLKGYKAVPLREYLESLCRQLYSSRDMNISLYVTYTNCLDETNPYSSRTIWTGLCSNEIARRNLVALNRLNNLHVYNLGFKMKYFPINVYLGSLHIISSAKSSNYNRASRVCVCVWQPTPRTADVTVTKIAVYVRVRILMNRSFFVFILFTLQPLCWIYEYACYLRGHRKIGRPKLRGFMLQTWRRNK